MKLALITDIHYGIRNDYQPYLENNKKFFSEVFFPKLEEEGIKEIVMLGDLLDRRKYVNYLTAHYLDRDFFRPIADKGIKLHWILGNHDIYYRDTTDISAKILMAATPGQIYREATEVDFEGSPILFIPWIVADNQKQIFDKIKETRSQIAMGHLEIDGCEMQKGQIKYGGIPIQLFQKFAYTFSGHFHQQSIRDNVRYLGAHAEFIWSDYDQQRGFHIFDTSTRQMFFVANPYTVFRKIYYDDAKGHPILPEGGFESLGNRIVKLVVSGKNDPAQYDLYVSKVEAANPLDITVVDDHLNVNLTGESEIVSESKDTLEIIREYIKQANNVVNTRKLDDLIVSLYNQAQVNE